ncbi:MAG: 50S ribosomal protein L4 [Clostridia bacterium]|nr:50S ribosomal protein L4 [Clostridia bacterium]
MLTDVLDKTGKKVGDINLSDKIFGICPNMPVLHESIVAYLANQRQGTKSALTRAEVSGGGAKPWRQKGTGHARQGSTRAPQWRHGGIVFAPKPRDYSRNLNKKVRKLAVKSVLSLKQKNKNLIILEDFLLETYKTKLVLEILKNLNIQKAVFVLPSSNKFFVKSAANISGIKVLSAESLNSYDIFYHEKLVIFKSSVSKIEEIFDLDKNKNNLDKSEKVVA